MAFLTDVFPKKAAYPDMKQPAKPSIPTEKVLRLRQQGLNNDQIIQNLLREGYEIDQVSNAINQADAKEGVQSLSLIEKGDTMPQPYSTAQMPGEQQMPPAQGPMPQDYGNYPPAMQGMGNMSDAERIQEIAESIIDEKWADLVENINRMVAWKDKTEAKINKMEQEFADLKTDFDRLHSSILEKVSDYDKNIMEVGTNIKALEKVFEKIMPGFIENINELGRITQTMKATARAPVKK